MNWTVSKEESGLKLVAFLKQKLNDYSSRQLKSLLESNLCTINGVTERFGSIAVYAGDRIALVVEAKLLKNKAQAALQKERILYEDDVLLAYDKPAAIASEEIKSPYHLVHRLDRDTTGVLLFAKTKAAFDALVALFRGHQIKKTYYAIVEGVPKEKRGTVDNFLGKKHLYQGQTIWGSVPSDKGLRAVTDWEVDKSGRQAALIRCFPKSGRTHQLRVHLSEMGHPILGDFQYCRRFISTYQPARCLLHAAVLSFPHPITHKTTTITSLIPEDFSAACKELSL